MSAPRKYSSGLWAIVVFLWIGSSLFLKSQILSGRWGSVPGPGLVSITIGNHAYFTSTVIGFAYIGASVGLAAVGIIFAVKSAKKK
jgi:hypothetical protein